MGPGNLGDTYGFGGSITFGPGGVTGTVGGGAGTAAPCGPGTNCGQNNFAIIVLVVAVVVLILR